MMKFNFAKLISVLTIIFLFNVHNSNKSHALDVEIANFGGIDLKIPKPVGQCNFGSSQREKLASAHTRELQRGISQKPLGMWADCESLKKVASGRAATLKEWTVVVGGLTGDPPLENLFPEVKNQEFIKGVEKELGLTNFGQLENFLKQQLGESNKKYLKNETAITSEGMKPMGVLSKTNSLNYGFVSEMKDVTGTMKILTISSAMLVNGVPLAVQNYKPITGEIDVKKFLEAAEDYSDLLFYLNK